LRLYVKMMPFAFLLFVIWLYEFYCRYGRWEKKQETPFPDPLRFLLVLLGYPLVFAFFTWKSMEEKGRNIVAQAELRRTKRDLFGALSREELSWLKEFKENNLSLSVWKKHLASLNLKPRHCLVAAIIATLVISLLPAVSQAEVGVSAKDCFHQIVWMQGGSIHIGIGHDGQDHSTSQQDNMVALVEDFNLDTVLPASTHKIQKVFLRLEKLCREIYHVPLCGYSV
jgi:hypothetical protein